MKNIETKDLKKAFKHVESLYSIFSYKNKDIELKLNFLYYAIKVELNQRNKTEKKEL